MPDRASILFAAKAASLAFGSNMIFAAVLLTGTIAFFAEIMPQEMIWPIIEKTGALGVLAWFLWYSTSRAQPQMMANYAAMIEKIATAYTTATKEMLVTFASELKDIREDNERWRDHHSGKIIQP